MSYERGCQEKTSPRPAAIQFLCSQSPFAILSLHGLHCAVPLSCCSPILRREASAEKAVSSIELCLRMPNFITKLAETSSSFVVGHKMPTMVLLEPLRATALSGRARGHRVYMGTRKRRMLPATHFILILTLDPGSSLSVNRPSLSRTRCHCKACAGCCLISRFGS